MPASHSTAIAGSQGPAPPAASVVDAGVESELSRASRLSTSAAGAPLRSQQREFLGLPGRFWLAYLAHLLMMTAAGMMYRYADLVTYLGGSELELGWIVGVGMIGSLTMRLTQGTVIDRAGPRDIWLFSLALLAASLAGHVWVQSAHGPAIYLLQILYRTALAGVFGASFTYVFQLLPPQRMGEGVGMIGIAGFMGMIVGPVIGDAIASGARGHGATALVAANQATAPLQRGQIDALFLTAAGVAVAGFIVAWIVTRGNVRPPRRKELPLYRALRRYHGGPVLLMGVTMGVAIGLPATFVRTFASDLSIERIGPFFAIYSGVAIAARLFTYRLTDRLGVRPMILLGNATMIVGVLTYLAVRTEAMLVVPAALTGIGHSLIFPAVIAGGSATFPRRYRGLGTTLILAMMDIGVLLGMPLVGGIVHSARQMGLPDYPTMFVCVTGLLTVTTVYYAWVSAARSGGRASAD